MYVLRRVEDALRWITIHPGKQEDSKGIHVQIEGTTGEIKAGMGGKFTGQKINEIGKNSGKADKKQEANEKPKETPKTAEAKKEAPKKNSEHSVAKKSQDIQKTKEYQAKKQRDALELQKQADALWEQTKNARMSGTQKLAEIKALVGKDNQDYSEESLNKLRNRINAGVKAGIAEFQNIGSFDSNEKLKEAMATAEVIRDFFERGNDDNYLRKKFNLTEKQLSAIKMHLKQDRKFFSKESIFYGPTNYAQTSMTRDLAAVMNGEKYDPIIKQAFQKRQEEAKKAQEAIERANKKKAMGINWYLEGHETNPKYVSGVDSGRKGAKETIEELHKYISEGSSSPQEFIADVTEEIETTRQQLEEGVARHAFGSSRIGAFVGYINGLTGALEAMKNGNFKSSKYAYNKETKQWNKV